MRRLFQTDLEAGQGHRHRRREKTSDSLTGSDGICRAEAGTVRDRRNDTGMTLTRNSHGQE